MLRIPLKKAMRLALCLALALTALLPAAALAQRTEPVVVRVGWNESPFNSTDQYGRRSGYAYAYQRKIAAYTGWRYEYVEGSWSELYDMLLSGEIDLLSDVSYTPERAERMLYSSLPMGAEAYYVLVLPDNDQIASDNPATLTGKRVGVMKNSFQKGLFADWCANHGVSPYLLELSGSEEDSLKLLQKGGIDAYITMDIYADARTAVPLWKIGSSDFFFAVNKARPDLLADLDMAMNHIQDENKYYNQQLHEQYLSSTQVNQHLSPTEKQWLMDHGTIRVGYQDNYLAFCAADPITGQLTGALKDYLDYAATCMEHTHLSFEASVYPTAAAAMQALKDGEVDCVFPANLTDYDSETLGVVMSPPLMRTEMDAVVRASEKKEFIRKSDVVVAVNEGNTNYDMFLADHYPTWRRAYFKDTPTGLEAVAAGSADCVIISNYRYNNISKQCDRLHLTTVYTGVDMDYSFAVREGDTILYSVLAKVTDVVPVSTINAALTYYSTEDVKTSFADLIKDNLFIVMTVIAAILLVILVLLLRSIRAERKAREEEHLLNDLNRKVFVDALTSVRNKGAFANYTKQMQAQIDGGEPMNFAIGVFDCDNLKVVNDQNGHDKGDIYLKSASQLICKTFQHSPVFRIGGDEFAVVLQNADLEAVDALVEQFDLKRREICAAASNKWEEVHVAMGIAVYDPQVDECVEDTIRRADRIMYENKRIGKTGGRS